jgi:hypothetical protein
VASSSTSLGGPRRTVGNRWASAGGGLGLLLVGIAVVGLASIAGDSEPPSERDEELEFLPGTLAKLGDSDVDHGDGSTRPAAAPGAAQPEAPTPEAPTPEAPTPEPGTSSPDVTIDPHPAAPSRPGHTPARPSSGGGTSPPRPGGGGLPGPPSTGGSPFGDPNGWDELTRSGDRWATDVLAALNAMVVRPFGADPGPGSVRFAITVCKDGKHTKVARKGGDAGASTHDAVAIAVEQLELPRIPAKLAATMRDDCMKIRYTFEWRNDRVE